MKILIGLDESPCSRAALEFVRKLAFRPGTHVTVVSAVRPVVVISEIYVPSMTTEELVKEQTQAHETLVSQAERELRNAGLATEGRVLQGDPREAIVQVAKDEGTDLIVVGSHGRTGIAKLVMGSVAAHVVTHAPCSVLVVKDVHVEKERLTS